MDLRLSIPAITARLNADPAAYPTPDGKPGWTERGVAAILANPKYTGHMVYGRTRNGHKPRPVPQAQWIWTPEPVHPAIIDRDTWEKAQHIGAVEAPADPSDPAAQAYRARIRERYAERYA